MTNRRVPGPAEAGITNVAGVALLVLSIIGIVWPLVIALPLALLAAWVALALLLRGRELRGASRRGVGSGASNARQAP